MFKLDFHIEISDIFLILGILIIAIGLYFIYMPAAVIFLGISLILLAFMVAPKPKKVEKKGGE